MKKSVLIVGLMAILFASCKKDDPEQLVPTPTQESVLDYFPLENGNYWVFEQALYDSSGNVFPQTYLNDSIVVKNDTIINNKTYHIVEEYNFAGSSTMRTNFYRDSADCIVNNEGSIVFSINPDFVEMQLLTPDSFAYVNYSFDDQITSITVPTGSYNCTDFRGELFRKEDNFSVSYPLHNYYCKNIGPIKKTRLFVSNLSYYELELVDYHVQ